MDMTTEDFARDCTMLAARALAIGPQHVEAATILTGLARTAYMSPQQPHPPIAHYLGEIEEALILLFGQSWEFADLSHSRREEAVAAWTWWHQLSGRIDRSGLTPTPGEAIVQMSIGREGWRERMRTALREGAARAAGIA